MPSLDVLANLSRRLGVTTDYLGGSMCFDYLVVTIGAGAESVMAGLLWKIP